MPLCHGIFCSRGSGRLLTVAIPLIKTATFDCKTSCSHQYTKKNKQGISDVSESTQVGVMPI